ncbi:MAG: NTP transferase domain-containing protein [Candidatus Paceibacterota bacterium]
MKNDNIKVVILAAGYGKRMQSELVKVLIPFHGKPLVAHVLDTVKESGICDRPVVVVGQQRELVMNTLGSSYDYAVQEEQLGTGHAVMSTESLLKDKTENIMVLYGDSPFISAKTIQKLNQKHQETGAKITMATIQLPDFNDWRSAFYTSFSRIVRDENSKIIKDVQFRDASEEEKQITEVNPCYFVFNGQWLWEKLKTLEANNDQKQHYLTDLVKIAMEEGERIETVNIGAPEGLAVNSKEELEIVKKFSKENF